MTHFPRAGFEPRLRRGILGFFACLITPSQMQVSHGWAFLSGILLAIGSRLLGHSAPRIGPMLAGISAAAGTVWVFLQSPFDSSLRSILFLLAPTVAAVACALQAARARVRYDDAEFHRTHDELTGCLNRRGLQHLCEQPSEGPDPSKLRGVAVFDCDNFKKFNDAHGHLAGDRFLERVGTYFASLGDQCQPVARWGGDEFVVAVASGSADEIVAVMTEIHDGLAKIQLDGTMTPRWTAGLVIAGLRLEFESHLDLADQLMLRTKHSAPGTLAIDDQSDSANQTAKSSHADSRNK